jgi:hypothetical protein
MGLHTIDTVRRDAEARSIKFETQRAGAEKAEVTLQHGLWEITYLIDLEVDVIEEIRFAHAEGKEGKLKFYYVQEIVEGAYFSRPPKLSTADKKKAAGDGTMWMMSLIESVK